MVDQKEINCMQLLFYGNYGYRTSESHPPSLCDTFLKGGDWQALTHITQKTCGEGEIRTLGGSITPTLA